MRDHSTFVQLIQLSFCRPLSTSYPRPVLAEDPAEQRKWQTKIILYRIWGKHASSFKSPIHRRFCTHLHQGYSVRLDPTIGLALSSILHALLLAVHVPSETDFRGLQSSGNPAHITHVESRPTSAVASTRREALTRRQVLCVTSMSAKGRCKLHLHSKIEESHNQAFSISAIAL